MSKDLNYCSFIGRLGQSIDVKYLPSGKAVANFSIACNDGYKDKNTGEYIDKTNWINIVFFGKAAEIAGQYLNKGSKVFISGKQVTRSWDKEGEKRYVTEIIGNEMQFLDSKQDSRPAAAGQPRQSAPHQHQNNMPDDDFDDGNIPF